jgi:hypothetical protein
MSHQWIYNGHQDDAAKIVKIYCSRIIPSVPITYMWLVKTKNGEERPLNSYKESDFDNVEDVKAFNYALTNSSQLDKRELQKYLELSTRH